MVFDSFYRFLLQYYCSPFQENVAIQKSFFQNDTTHKLLGYLKSRMFFPHTRPFVNQVP